MADQKECPIRGIDHVQVAIPPGSEGKARAFYRDVLGLTEVPKPAPQVVRGGAWFETGAVKVHLGVEQDFRANDKAHVAFVVEDVGALADAARAAGYRVRDDDPLAGHVRAFLYDPFGNRIEILKPLEPETAGDRAMTTVTLELDDEHAERLKALAAEWVANPGDVVMAAFDLLDQAHAKSLFTPDQEAAIRFGLADAAAGRLVDHEDVMRDARKIVDGG